LIGARFWKRERNIFSYPIYAQAAYDNPREPAGRIVCANCHLQEKYVEITVPQSCFPDVVFSAVVKIPYDTSRPQLSWLGKKSFLNVGAVLILPDGFTLAPSARLSSSQIFKTQGLFILPYSRSKSNVLVLGPVFGDKNRQVLFPILSPSRVEGGRTEFLNYPVYVGGNRGRGQVYPDGGKSNNVAVTSLFKGVVVGLEEVTTESDIRLITFVLDTGLYCVQLIPVMLSVLVKLGAETFLDQFLTKDPNVGGFGQAELNIVFQEPLRIKLLVGFILSIALAQIFFVIKKKQFEEVQKGELNF
jgi:apocytochrome f